MKSVPVKTSTSAATERKRIMAEFPKHYHQHKSIIRSYFVDYRIDMLRHQSKSDGVVVEIVGCRRRRRRQEEEEEEEEGECMVVLLRSALAVDGSSSLYVAAAGKELIHTHIYIRDTHRCPCATSHNVT